MSKPPIPKIKIDAVMPSNPLDMKCAPNMDFENGSCFPLKLLISATKKSNFNFFAKHLQMT